MPIWNTSLVKYAWNGKINIYQAVELVALAADGLLGTVGTLTEATGITDVRNYWNKLALSAKNLHNSDWGATQTNLAGNATEDDTEEAQ